MHSSTGIQWGESCLGFQMRALTQSPALMTFALLEWCGQEWWSWVCQEALAITAQKWWTKPDCTPWPKPAPSYWPSNPGRNRWREVRSNGIKERKLWGKTRDRQVEWICIQIKGRGREQEGKRQKNKPLDFLHVTQITGNSFKGFFSCSVHSDSLSLSLHLTELMSRSSQTSEIFTSWAPVILLRDWASVVQWLWRWSFFDK